MIQLEEAKRIEEDQKCQIQKKEEDCMKCEEEIISLSTEA